MLDILQFKVPTLGRRGEKMPFIYGLGSVWPHLACVRDICIYLGTLGLSTATSHDSHSEYNDDTIYLLSRDSPHSKENFTSPPSGKERWMGNQHHHGSSACYTQDFGPAHASYHARVLFEQPPQGSHAGLLGDGPGAAPALFPGALALPNIEAIGAPIAGPAIPPFSSGGVTP